MLRTARTVTVASVHGTQLAEKQQLCTCRTASRGTDLQLNVRTTSSSSRRGRPTLRSRRQGQVFVIILVAMVVVVTVTGYFTWKILSARDNAVQRLIVSVKNQPSEEVTEVTQSVAAAAVSMQDTSMDSSVPLMPNVPISRSVRRYEVEPEPPTIWHFSPRGESQERYAWDDESFPEIVEGYITAGPWQVPATPRNVSRRSHFAND